MEELQQIENLTLEALEKLEQADQLIITLVENKKLDKCYNNTIYNIILQLKQILDI